MRDLLPIANQSSIRTNIISGAFGFPGDLSGRISACEAVSGSRISGDIKQCWHISVCGIYKQVTVISFNIVLRSLCSLILLTNVRR